MNPNAVNPNDSQAQGSDNTSRSVFGAPLATQTPDPQATSQTVSMTSPAPMAADPLGAQPQPRMPTGGAMNTQSSAYNNVANTTDNTASNVRETTDKEWAESAKSVVNMTTGNPFEKSQKLAALRLQYLATKFGKKPEANEQKI